MQLLESADWAPTHARTEPWRFIVFDHPRVLEFTKFHADLLKENSDPATFTQIRYDNIARLGNNVSHVIIPWMKRVPNHKIPEIEEVAAVSAAIQNLLLSATSMNIATFWSSSGLTHHDVFKKSFGLGEEDKVLGILYLGYTDEPFKEGTRMIPLSEKVEWRR
jgi:nitroreductase